MVSKGYLALELEVTSTPTVHGGLWSQTGCIQGKLTPVLALWFLFANFQDPPYEKASSFQSLLALGMKGGAGVWLHLAWWLQGAL